MKPVVFNSGKQYMSEEEADAVSKFMENVPDLSMVYTKGGTSQIAASYQLPIGSFIPGYSRHRGVPDPPDGTFFYTTPLATLIHQPKKKKTIRVWVKDIETEKSTIITGDQWLTFAKDAKTKPYVAERKGAFSMAKRDSKALLDNMKFQADKKAKENK